jgi:hypothetical protein
MISASGNDVIIDFSSLPAGTWTTQSKGDAIGYDTAAVNATLYHKIQVNSAADNGTDKTWEEANTICAGLGSGWRLPTQKELHAIWILKAEMYSVSGFARFVNDYYWTATVRTDWLQPNSYCSAYMVYMSMGYSGGSGADTPGDAGNTPYIIETHKARVRCIKEL